MTRTTAEIRAALQEIRKTGIGYSNGIKVANKLVGYLYDLTALLDTKQDKPTPKVK